MQEITFILGANLTNKKEYIDLAIQLLEWNIGLVVSRSHKYSSGAWGYESLNTYVNQVVVIQTSLSPNDALVTALKIETILGRKRKTIGYDDRTIDIDLLAIGKLIINTPQLVVPHPRLTERKFCLLPMLEANPKWIHPILNKDLSTLLEICIDDSQLKIMEH